MSRLACPRRRAVRKQPSVPAHCRIESNGSHRDPSGPRFWRPGVCETSRCRRRWTVNADDQTRTESPLPSCFWFARAGHPALGWVEDKFHFSPSPRLGQHPSPWWHLPGSDKMPNRRTAQRTQISRASVESANYHPSDKMSQIGPRPLLCTAGRTQVGQNVLGEDEWNAAGDESPHLPTGWKRSGRRGS